MTDGRYARDLYIPGILSCRQMHSHDHFMARISFRKSNALAVRVVFYDFKIDVSRDLLWQVVASGTANDYAVIGMGDATFKVLRSDPATFCLAFSQRFNDEERAAYNKLLFERFDEVEAQRRMLGANESPRAYVLFRRHDLFRWLKHTYEIVGYGQEVRECDLDNAIAKILEGSK